MDREHVNAPSKSFNPMQSRTGLQGELQNTPLDMTSQHSASLSSSESASSTSGADSAVSLRSFFAHRYTRNSAQDSQHRLQHSWKKRLGSAGCWLIAVLACAWVAWCSAIGPIMRTNVGLSGFSFSNVLIFIVMFAICLGVVTLLVRSAHAGRFPAQKAGRQCFIVTHINPPDWLTHFLNTAGRWIMRATSTWWLIWLVLAIGWLWVPTTLLSAFGADIRSQAREFAWAWNQWTGVEQPYIGFFSFVPMDIYPTAHYLWPTDPTYLTDQHNIVLTVFYGAATAVSRYFTQSNDAGLVVLSVLQWLFAGFCCASAANRFLNMPWLQHSGKQIPDFAHPERGTNTIIRDFMHPERAIRSTQSPYTAGPVARLLIMLLFIGCPLVFFSTISLTKSPLFAFAFTWWFGLMYELYMTYRAGKPRRTRTVTCIALFVSCAVMLISAKYAWYIIAAQIVLSLLADRRRWKLYLLTLLLPTVLIHGGISLLISSGSIIGGDPIESRGAQLQMIARVAKNNPNAISESAKEKLAPIFNIDQMAQAYRPQDTDPVKSSGIQSKKVSYRWRTVTAEDMDNFNAAWLEIVRADPRTAMDALFAKSYGYFDIFDKPYVAMSYYINNDYVQDSSTWIKNYNHNWRNSVVKFEQNWSKIPVLGWLVHGNFYVTLTLLIGAAELVLKRWRALSWHIPLLLLMGVMITAPADNFERHMLPLVFVFGFLCLMFARDNKRNIQS